MPSTRRNLLLADSALAPQANDASAEKQQEAAAVSVLRLLLQFLQLIQSLSKIPLQFAVKVLMNTEGQQNNVSVFFLTIRQQILLAGN